jgi:transposase-like protein
MGLRDRCFESLLGFAIVLTLMNLLLATAQYAIMVDSAGRPLGFKSRINCPACGSESCYVSRYPVYRCRSCQRKHALKFADREYPHLAAINQP